MSKEKDSKLNHLLSMKPAGIVVTSSWLSAHGYSPQLVKRYCVSGWLKKIANRVYLRLNDSLTQDGSLYALQFQLNLSLHLGGLSALELRGLGHNIVMNDKAQPCYLYNSANQFIRLPKWVNQYYPHIQVIQKQLFKNNNGIEELVNNGIPLLTSTAERAIIETCDGITHVLSYEHLNNLIENMQLLRPNHLQQLLEQCNSILAKRLFLYLAEKHNIPCFKHLKFDKISLGSGKRVIAGGGKYIAKYQISVPQNKHDDNVMDDTYV